jgi:hypothetical protein
MFFGTRAPHALLKVAALMLVTRVGQESWSVKLVSRGDARLLKLGADGAVCTFSLYTRGFALYTRIVALYTQMRLPMAGRLDDEDGGPGASPRSPGGLSPHHPNRITDRLVLHTGLTTVGRSDPKPGFEPH